MENNSQLIKYYETITNIHVNFLKQQKDSFVEYLQLEYKILAITSHLSEKGLSKVNGQRDKSVSPSQAYQDEKSATYFNRDQLVAHSLGKISSLFGPQFEVVDTYKKSLKLPAPPFLLVDRVIHISSDSVDSNKKIIITETDLGNDKWFLHENHIMPGYMLEASQGHILLLSFLGLDFANKGEKVYRMLGGTFKFLGSLPSVGDVLTYNIRVTAPSPTLNNLITLEFDCFVRDEIKLIVRKGRVGFFSESELSSPKGIIWDPIKIKYTSSALLPPPLVKCHSSQFNRRAIEAFARGDTFACFGSGFEKTQTHSHSPRIPAERMLIIDEIDDFDPYGGPWQRGYLKAIQHVSPDDWFFQCHFINDPVMPGSLSIEAFFQSMAFYLAGLGYTIEKDGWIFDVVPDKEYTFQARGEVKPSTKGIIYEIFVEEVIASPNPTLFASLLATTFEGIKIYQLSHFGVRLVQDKCLSHRPELALAK